MCMCLCMCMYMCTCIHCKLHAHAQPRVCPSVTRPPTWQASKRKTETTCKSHHLDCDTGDAATIARLVLEAVEERRL